MTQPIPERLQSPFCPDRVDERKATLEFEEMVGVSKAFQMMRIYQDCHMHARKDPFRWPKATREMQAEAAFRLRAAEAGFNDEAIEFYLNYIR